MPDKPTWLGRLDPAIAELRSLPWPWVDRATLERVLGVGRRRAQQLLAPLVRHQIGSTGVADREELIRYLEQLAAGESGYYERRRRLRFAETLGHLKDSWIQHPRVLIEAPVEVVNQEIADLPAGVSLRPGEIVVRFETAVEALEKLLALTMAAGNDLDRFERMVDPQRREAMPDTV